MAQTTETVPPSTPVIANVDAHAPQGDGAPSENGSDPQQRVASGHIVLRGARQHNLKGVDLDLPRGKLVVFSGPSGSGKSSLAFDTIYAEGQRRYVESLSAYARQFLERMDKPDADLITGLAPAIAIEQKAPSKNPRSTVATQTEVYDHLRLLFARLGTTISPVSGQEVTKDTPRSVALETEDELDEGEKFYLCFPVPEHSGWSLTDELESLLKKGFARLLLLPTEKQREKGNAPELIDLNDKPPEKAIYYGRGRLLVLVDRLAARPGDESARSRVADSAEQAFTEGQGRCCVVTRDGATRLNFSAFFERDGMRFEEPRPLLFSFNSPLGACPECEGFGRVPGIDPDLVIPNKRRSIRDGAIAPFQSDKWSKHLRALVRVAADEGLDIDAPYKDLPEETKRIVWEGKGDYIGVEGFFDFLDSKSYKMHYRILRARYRGYSPCPACDGTRLRDQARYVQVGGRTIGEIAQMTTREARDFFEELELTEHEEDEAGRVIEELRKRSRYLVDVGLDYLTLDRLAQTLSGGEAQRINLSTSLGSSLVGSLYVLDEPTIGLHPRDLGRLIDILHRLRNLGNTVLVVEHDPATLEAADQLVDVGPGSGRYGGEVVFQGTFEEIKEDEDSLTGRYLSGREKIALPERRDLDEERAVVVKGARQHNLKGIDAAFPLGGIVCVTGVSGSGKSTLVESTLFEGLRRRLGEEGDGKVGTHDDIEGAGRVGAVEMVDQSPIGRSPRSNPATYTGAFDGIRKLLAGTRTANLRGLDQGYFSFNTPGGRCENCEGQGVVKVEMQFLADLYLECEVCGGTRYKQDALEVRYRGKNVANFLAMTIDEAADFFSDQATVVNRLTALQRVGLGYLSLGQPSTTLSGGEAQRMKLASHLSGKATEGTLYLFDEPTTGLHFADIKQLLLAFRQLVEAGHSVVIVEHNLEVLKSADWILDLGPEGGRRGGDLVCAGPPERVADCDASHTGRFLRAVL